MGENSEGWKVERETSHRNIAWVVALIVAVVALIALAARNDSVGDGDGGGDETVSSVDWENYAPVVKTRIDSMAASGDCSGLQSEFDTADANDDAQRSRTGDGNADLMGYIDDKLESAGCYG